LIVFKVERTLLNEGVSISKHDEDGKVLGAIVVPWDKAGEVCAALGSRLRQQLLGDESSVQRSAKGPARWFWMKRR
jgi:hypothetical protein